MKAQLLTAAFFMEGLHEAKPGGYDALIPAWNKGCIEMVDALVRYVPFAIQLCDAAAKANDDCYPGVFDYEVSGPFGKWFGEYILEHGDEPPHTEALAWLEKEVTAFFKQ
jgi:hypothetical protein